MTTKTTNSTRPTYPVDIRRYTELKQQISHYVRLQSLPAHCTVDDYLSTHLYTLSLKRSTGDDDLTLRAIVDTVAGNQLKAMLPRRVAVPLGIYSEPAQPLNGGTGATGQVAAVLWPCGTGGMILGLMARISEEVATFAFRPAFFDGGDHYQAIERVLCPNLYLGTLKPSV